MTTITVTRNDEGKVVGAGEKHAKAWVKFRKLVQELEPGELFQISHWFPRNPKLHGLHFAMLEAVFDAQEQFADTTQFRKWVETGAGHCDFVPGPTGKMIALPKSIAWDELDDADFQAHHEDCKAFLRSLHATRFLWPHLEDAEAGAMMGPILDSFERE